jgi:hypothetical protein
MKNLTLAILALLCSLSLAGFTSREQGASGSNSTVIVSNARPSPVQILSPRPGEKLQQNAVSVRYAFQPEQNAPAPPTPNYLVRLDGRDPIQTQDTEATFTGLSAGPHTVTVELVDANGMAIPGARSQVQFTVNPQVPGQSGAGQQNSPGQGGSQSPSTNPRRPPQSRLSPQIGEDLSVQAFGLGLDEASEKTIRSTADELAAGNSIPLFSCIGAGVLLGGWFSARRTTRAK